MASRVCLKPELKDVVQQLKSKFPVAYSEVDPDRVVYLESTSKSKQPVKLASIKLPHPSVSPYRFSLTVYTRLWRDLSDSHKVLYIHRELLRITNFEEGKLSNYPLNDFPEIIAKFGVNWRTREDLPNILQMEE